MGKKAPWVEKSKEFTGRTYSLWLNKLYNIALTRFEWFNLPKGCDEKFIERVLVFSNFMAGYYDPDFETHLIMPATTSGMLSISGYPAEVTAYGYNGYIRNGLVPYDNITALTPDRPATCALLYDNYSQMPIFPGLIYYADKLTRIDRTLDVNINVQKTPWIIRCNENERLTVINALSKIDDYQYSIVANKNLGEFGDKIDVMKLDAPFIADKLQIIKRQIWQEALTFLGIEANTSEKSERQITDEIAANLGETESLRQSPLAARQEFCKKFNDLFNTNVQVRFRSNLKLSQLEGGLEDGILYNEPAGNLRGFDGENNDE